MPKGIKVAPASRRSLRALATHLRTQIGVESAYFPILEFIDLGLGHHFPELIVDVVPKSDMPVEHGVTMPDQQIILIREDVYEGAANGRGRDRFTLAHELGHLILHTGVPLSRSSLDHKPYEDSEWQANTFASELLMPVEASRRCYPNTSELAELCGVSSDAARVRFSVLLGEGLIRK